MLMIIPDFWGEHKETRKIAAKNQVTISRFGWSETSQADAKDHAEKRVEEAFKKLSDGQDVERRELRVSYNGSEGVPIREEVIQYHDDAVLSRNIYGSLCLNTPDVAFADIDFGENDNGKKVGTFWLWTVFTVGFLYYYFTPNMIYDFSWNVLGYELQYWFYEFLYDINPGLFISIIAATAWVARFIINARSHVDAEQFAEQAMQSNLDKISLFIADNPKWGLRIYRTPAGMRIMVMHDVFLPSDPAIHNFFASVNCDPVYSLMCRRQECFRARVSPKPWRIGLEGEDIKIRPKGVWPIKVERMTERKKWIARYEKLAEEFASCRFDKSIGSDVVHNKCEKLRIVHDQYCRADSDLPLA
jgi:hypothetical protein